MPFNTYTFLVFFLAVVLIYQLLPGWKLQKTILLISSYIFYASWNPVFVFLLFISTISDWFIARFIYESDTQNRKKLFVYLSLIVNLGLLGYFKYGNFLVDNFSVLAAIAGINFQPVDYDILLPVGISFYTFQTLSYTIDVYRGKIRPALSFLDYALYVSYFPQLVAGPIVRADDFLPQCVSPKKVTADQFGWGLALIIIGLFMKTCLSDTVFAPVVDTVFSQPAASQAIDIWTALFSFSGQIYCDFAGYSTIAIGTALCFGFVLPRNFSSPYSALGFSDFWHRWHISLSTWLRDYLYISLGGNRTSTFRTYVNLMLTMLIGGLWHGASWMYVIWGGIHGLYLVIEKMICSLITRPVRLSPFTEYLLILVTFVAVSFTWLFFRADSMQTVALLLTNIFSSSGQGTLAMREINLALACVLLVVSWHVYSRNQSIGEFFKKFPPYARGVIMFSLVLIIYLFASGDDRAFIYFQF